MTDVVAGGFDAAIRLGEVIERDMIALRPDSDLRQIVVASPAYFAAHGAPAMPQDLLIHRCIRWRWPGHDAPHAWKFCKDGRWFAVAVTDPLITSSCAFGVNAAVDAVGIAFVVGEAIAHHVAAGRLVPLLESWSVPFPGLFLCYPRQRNMAPALRAFINALRSGPAIDHAELLPAKSE